MVWEAERRPLSIPLNMKVLMPGKTAAARAAGSVGAAGGATAAAMYEAARGGSRWRTARRNICRWGASAPATRNGAPAPPSGGARSAAAMPPPPRVWRLSGRGASGTFGAGAAAATPARDRRRLKALQRTAARLNMLHIFDRVPTRMYSSGAAGWAELPPPPSTPPADGSASTADGGGSAAAPAPAATEEEEEKEKGALVPAYVGLLTHAAECMQQSALTRPAAAWRPFSCAAPHRAPVAALRATAGADSAGASPGGARVEKTPLMRSGPSGSWPPSPRTPPADVPRL